MKNRMVYNLSIIVALIICIVYVTCDFLSRDNPNDPKAGNYEEKIFSPEINIRYGNDNIITGASLDIGNSTLNVAKNLTFTLENLGNMDLNVTLPIAITGDASFAVSQDPPAVITPSNNSSFIISFTPSTTGSLSAEISITNDDSDENPFKFTLTGSGVSSPQPEINIKQSSEDIPVNGNFDFGDTPLNNPVDMQFTIENTGSEELTLNNPVFDGGDYSMFSFTENPESPVTISGSTTFTIRFNPATPGEKATLVKITNNDPDENPYSFTIAGEGTGTTGPEINLKQDTTDIPVNNTFDFGSTSLNVPVDVTFTIENTGIDNLTVSNPTFTGGDYSLFSLTANPSSPVAPSGTTDFTISFTPVTSGVKTTNVGITNNDSDESPYTFTVTGTGTAPEINLSCDSTDIPVGGELTVYISFSATHTNTRVTTFTIENLGNQSLTVDDPEISGSGSAYFNLSAGPVSPVTASGSTTFDITFFEPSAPSTRTATISIANNDADEDPYTYTINGVLLAYPSNCQATDDADDQINLSWDSVTGANKYVIWNCESFPPYSPTTQLDTTTATSYSFPFPLCTSMENDCGKYFRISACHDDYCSDCTDAFYGEAD